MSSLFTRARVMGGKGREGKREGGGAAGKGAKREAEI